MRAPVYIYDPTIADTQSKVRGIGRYLQILRENAPSDWIFTEHLKGIPSHSVLIQPFYTFYQPPLITKRITDHQIAVIHDVVPLKYPEHYPIGLKAFFYSLIERFHLHLYDHFITDSETSKEDIASYLKIKKEKISVVYPTLARCFWEHPIHRSLPSDYCLYVGDGTWNKNLSTLARAIKKTNITCIFAGKIFSDPNPEHYTHPWQLDLQLFFKEAMNDKRFIFAGYVTDKELLNLYVQAKLNILLSHDEGFGFSYVEAGSLGCPSLLSDRPIFHEIAGTHAAFVDETSPEKIAATLTSLVGNTDRLNQLSVGALEQSSKYNSESFKKRLHEVVYPY
ncbi:MAG: glycosyltransferase family 1 protein [Candidatus Roizmanbacteria bacterium]|nr:glycosyltransferase family 1 protein [Candidatus Roizmanbacteria bacterium]